MDRVGVIGRRLERLYRQVGTGLAFLMFGLGGLLLTVTAFPLYNLVIHDPIQRADLAAVDPDVCDLAAHRF